MSVADLGLTPHQSFVSPIPHGRLEQPSARSETLTKRYDVSLGRTQSELDLKSAQLRLLLDLTNGMVAHVEINDLLRERRSELGDSCNQILPSWTAGFTEWPIASQRFQVR